MRILTWLIRAFLFFVLFAFALNNGHDAHVSWFFGYEWRSSMVFIVLAAFTLGCAFGVLAMVPSWWKHRRVAKKLAPPPVADSSLAAPEPTPTTPPEHPPRDGL